MFILRETPLMRYVWLTLLLLACVSVAQAAPTLSGKNVLVLYKKLDSQSKQTALYYAKARKIPADQLVAVDILSSPDRISPAKFAQIQKQIAPHLTNNIKVIVMTWHAPYRVGCMSMTSAMTLGFDKQYCSHNEQHPRGCHPTTISPYFNAADDVLWNNKNLRLSMMLSGRTLDEAKQLIDRGVAADNSQPKGQGFLVATQDWARSTRAPIFQRFAAMWPEPKGVRLLFVDDHRRKQGTSVANKNDVLFYFTGYVQVPDIKTNHYLPGAIADHLTSYGGAGIKTSGQMKAYRWLEAGVTGSYGTVVEPCSYPEKFSNPQILIPAYMHGDTLIEAYWKSVQQPGEGIFIGEPLARPWAN